MNQPNPHSPTSPSQGADIALLRGPGHNPLRLRVERVLAFIATIFAVIGGVALILMSLITVYSIIGRALPADLPLLGWWRSVRGNFELVEFATAIAIFSFLPYTHIKRGNVLVDFFTMNISRRAKAGFAIFANLLYTVIALIFAWRMVVSAEAMLTASFTQTSMLLRIPIWYAYLPSTIFMCFLAVVGAYSVWRSVDEALGAGESEEGE